ncbi:MAG: DUF2695 domain-containing protein [Austwickia sp.]|jgi:hypothetical protein|nr:MAG: DUF2695 domain-containing protein [Austwickia sp.]
MESIVNAVEVELRQLSVALTWPRRGECLACYLDRMMQHGCTGELRWAGRYRDLMAPRATGLERRLGTMGGYCDCEVLMNAYVPLACLAEPAAAPPELGPCRGVRPGSTQPCALWSRRPRYAGWADGYSA